MTYDDVVGVYYANQDLAGPPAFNVPRENAREQVELKFAQWKKRTKAIQMNYTSPSLHRPAQSLSMGPEVTEMACEGSEYHQEMAFAWSTTAWKPRHFGVEAA